VLAPSSWAEDWRSSSYLCLPFAVQIHRGHFLEARGPHLLFLRDPRTNLCLCAAGGRSRHALHPASTCLDHLYHLCLDHGPSLYRRAPHRDQSTGLLALELGNRGLWNMSLHRARGAYGGLATLNVVYHSLGGSLGLDRLDDHLWKTE